MGGEKDINLSGTTGELKNKGQTIKVADIDIALSMLNRHMDSQAIKDIDPLISALEALKAEPQNEARQIEVVKAFNGLGFLQGAVLTYAPYLNVFVSDDPF